MKKYLIVVQLAILASVLALQTPAGDKPKPKSLVALDPEKAGPDWQVQGEYIGEIAEKGKLGAEVIARGDGNFQVNFLPGGLRGEGGDYSKHIAASGKTQGEKTTIQSKDGKWTAEIVSGKMTGKTAEGQSFTLVKTIRKSKTLGLPPPPGAIVLYDGKSTDEWKNVKVVDGNLVGNETTSKKSFTDHKVHLEFRLSFMPFASGQGRSNSGVYLQKRNEVQVLDSFGLKGQANECGGLYGQAAPKVNMCFPPLTWQTYDIEFKAARFDQEGKKVSNAVISVWHNGVLIHDRVELKDSPAKGEKNGVASGPLHLQSHGGQVQYRNIWVVDLSKDSNKSESK